MNRPTAQALVLVDLQRDWFEDPTLRMLEPQIVEASVETAQRANDAGALVVQVRTMHDPLGSTWALNMRQDGQAVAVAGSAGAEPLPGLEHVGSVTVAKTRDSAFHGTELARLLARHGVRTLALGGVSTESCVLSTASDAYAHDLRVLLVEDLIGCVDAQWHDRSLAHLATRFRQPLVSRADVRFEQGRPG